MFKRCIKKKEEKKAQGRKTQRQEELKEVSVNVDSMLVEGHAPGRHQKVTEWVCTLTP